MSISLEKNSDSLDHGTLSAKHASNSTVDEITYIVEKYFSGFSDSGLELTESKYFETVKAAQDELNDSNIAFKIVNEIKSDLSLFPTYLVCSPSSELHKYSVVYSSFKFLMELQLAPNGSPNFNSNSIKKLKMLTAGNRPKKFAKCCAVRKSPKLTI